MAPPSNQLLILLPWSVFALAAGLKFWQVSRWLRRPRLVQPTNTEQIRASLERIWQRQQNAA
jgi:hypothetical protein